MLDSTTNGIAIFFSCAYSPGAMNSHTCVITSGSAITAPAMPAMVR
jgi:hypothetical protein